MMNVVPISGPNTSPVIYDRGLIGVIHDWYNYPAHDFRRTTSPTPCIISTSLVMFLECSNIEQSILSTRFTSCDEMRYTIISYTYVVHVLGVSLLTRIHVLTICCMLLDSSAAKKKGWLSVSSCCLLEVIADVCKQRPIAIIITLANFQLFRLMEL